jgi:hypothetical protein
MRSTLFALLCLFSLNANAGFFHAGKLHEVCFKERIDYVSGGVCSGYIAAIHDTWDGRLFCTPSSVSLGEVVAQVKSEISDLPVSFLKKYDAETAINSAITKRWPCAEGTGASAKPLHRLY